MTTTRIFTPCEPASSDQMNRLTSFLFQHLEEYGDHSAAIEKAMQYAVSTDTPGGYIFELSENGAVVSAAVVNKTGMKDYIPENILVYIATHKENRGRGLGKQLMQQVVDVVEGDIALHVEPQNPAKKLYERFGFVNKYLEMRLIKK